MLPNTVPNEACIHVHVPLTQYGHDDSSNDPQSDDLAQVWLHVVVLLVLSQQESFTHTKLSPHPLGPMSLHIPV